MTDCLPEILPQKSLCLQRWFFSLLLTALLIQTTSTSTLAQGSIGIRAGFQGGVLHVEWDPAPVGAEEWKIQVTTASSDFFNPILFVCGAGIVGVGSCNGFQFGLERTSLDLDFTERLLAGSLIGSLQLSVRIDALAGGPIASGAFSADLPTPPVLLKKVGGDGQSGKTNTRLPDPFEVQFTRMGQPMTEARTFLFWVLAKAPVGAVDQQVENSFQLTRGVPRIGTHFTLGSEEGEYQVMALCSHICGENRQGDSVIFTAFAIKGFKLEKDPVSDNQTGRIGTLLPRMLVVKVTDPSGQPVSGKEIAFNSIAPDGTRSFVGTDTTASDGKAKIGYTLGKQSGKSYLIEATCSECEPKTETFTANTAKINLKMRAEKTELWPDGTSGDPKSTDVIIEAKDGLEGTYGPISGYPINIERQFEPKGHLHQAIPLPEHMKGAVNPSCTTGFNGECLIGFVASEVAGTANMVAKSALEEVESNRLTLTIQVPGLGPLGASTEYRLTGKFGDPNVTSEHTENHNGTASTLVRLIIVTQKYLKRTGYTLGINDISLPWGGLFDIGNNWAPDHHWHREGKSVDLDRAVIKFGEPGKSQTINCLDDRELRRVVQGERLGDLLCESGGRKHIEFP